MTGVRPLALCYGTRPQVIKASRLLADLANRWRLVTIDTGQHYDYELNDLLYRELGVRRPDRFLEVGSADHATQTAAILTRSAGAFAELRPWAVLVIGDTNSTLGAALAAVKLRIPVVHVEAGLRVADRWMPEEINRRLVDAVASLLCAPSVGALERLRQEGAGTRAVFTGDVARDVLLRHLDQAPDGRTGPDRPFAFVTLHRAALTDDRASLAAVVDGLSAFEIPVVAPLHPRTRAALARHGLLDVLAARARLDPPIGYLETLARVRDAAVVVTDSGGVQREAYWLGTPCVTLRTETEWSETVALGANHLVPPQHAGPGLPAVVRRLLHEGAARTWDRDAYGDGAASARIAEAIGHLAERLGAGD